LCAKIPAIATQITMKIKRRETADSIELNNSVTVEITTNDRRRLRGRTVIAATP
jgi:thioredoxin reductase